MTGELVDPLDWESIALTGPPSPDALIWTSRMVGPRIAEVRVKDGRKPWRTSRRTCYGRGIWGRWLRVKP